MKEEYKVYKDEEDTYIMNEKENRGCVSVRWESGRSL